MIRLAVTGATGRMGSEVLSVATGRDDVDPVLAVSHSTTGDAIGGIEIEPASDLDALLEEREPSVLIDFTVPDSSLKSVQTCAKAGVAAVVGTTGFDDEHLRALHTTSDDVPLLVSPNFAKGVHVLLSVVSNAVERLPGYDVEVTETHHNAKRDAPSGTANRILETIEEVRGDAERVHGRAGEAPRESGEIGVHARRAGNVTGEHEVFVAGDDEELRLVHRAESRGVFAAGAIDAAVWLAGRDAGWYDFSEVLET